MASRLYSVTVSQTISNFFRQCCTGMTSIRMTLQPDCLRWARQRASLSQPDLAKKLGVNEDRVAAWETSGEITFSLAEKLASATHTPLGFLYLPEPPTESLPVSDFRTVDATAISQPSPDLLDVINDALRKQDWYRDYLIGNGASPLPFVKSLSANSQPAEAAETIRASVDWNAGLRAKSTSWEAALAAQIDVVENAGVLVMRSGIVGSNTHRPLSVSEFRGFALSDEYAPLVFINAKDSKAAQIFTLAHELVHVWLGVSGVFNLNQTYSPDVGAERFCNHVAAELLVPFAELKTQWGIVENYADRVQRLTRYFKVSSLVILRRLNDAEYITKSEFDRLYTDELTQFNQKRVSSGGGDFYLTLRARLGKRFISAIVESTLEGETLYRDAYHLLGVKNTNNISKLAAMMEAGG